MTFSLSQGHSRALCVRGEACISSRLSRLRRMGISSPARLQWVFVAIGAGTNNVCVRSARLPRVMARLRAAMSSGIVARVFGAKYN